MPDIRRDKQIPCKNCKAQFRKGVINETCCYPRRDGGGIGMRLVRGRVCAFVCTSVQRFSQNYWTNPQKSSRSLSYLEITICYKNKAFFNNF